MNKAFIILLFIISIFCLTSNYLIKKSLQGEFALNYHFPNTTATLAQVDSLFSFYPTLGATAYPINLYRAKAALMYDKLKKDINTFLKRSKTIPTPPLRIIIFLWYIGNMAILIAQCTILKRLFMPGLRI